MVDLEANVGVKDKRGKTVLMYAVEYGSIGAFQLLLTKGADITVKDNDNKTAIAYFGLYNDNRLSQFIDFIKCIYENYMNLNEVIINQIRVHLDSYRYRESENYIKAGMLLFQIKNSGDLKAKFNNQPDALLTIVRDLFVEARNYRIQRIIDFWGQQKWYRKAYKCFGLINHRKRNERKASLPAEMIEEVFSFFLPRYLEGKIVFNKDILDASGGVIGAEECSVMVTSYHCQESAEEMEKLLRQKKIHL